MEEHPRLQERHAPHSPPLPGEEEESESTVATKDLPDTADWIALRTSQDSSQKALTTFSDTQETVLTEDLPATNDWLRLRQSRTNRKFKSPTVTTTTTTTTLESSHVSSSSPKATTNTTRLAPSAKVTPPLQDTSEKHTRVFVSRTPDCGEKATTWSVNSKNMNANPLDQIQNVNNPTNFSSSSSSSIHWNEKHHATTSPVSNRSWKSDPVSPLTEDFTRSQNVNSTTASGNSSNSNWNVKHHSSSPMRPWNSDPVSPLTEEFTQTRSQIVNRTAANTDHSTNQNMLIAKDPHRSPVSGPWKFDPVSPFTQDFTQKRKSQHLSVTNYYQQKHSTIQKPQPNDTESLPSPLLLTRKRILPPESPANRSIDPFLVARTKPSTIVSQTKKDDIDATPSPPPKEQPWFQKKTRKRKLQQMRLKFG